MDRFSFNFYDINISAPNGVLRNDTDPEGDALTVTTVADEYFEYMVGNYGGLEMNADGSYGYFFTKFVNPGQIVSDTFTYGISDGHGGTDTATLTIRIQGTQNVVKEDNLNYQTVSGQLALPEGLSFSTSYDPLNDDFFNYASSFSIRADGSWTFNLRNNDPAVQSLGEGDMKILTIAVQSTDFSVQEFIRITVLGTNDIPFFFRGTGSVHEDFTLSTSGVLDIFDRDAGEDSFITILIPQNGIYGDFTMLADGH